MLSSLLPVKKMGDRPRGNSQLIYRAHAGLDEYLQPFREPSGGLGRVVGTAAIFKLRLEYDREDAAVSLENVPTFQTGRGAWKD